MNTIFTPVLKNALFFSILVIFSPGICQLAAGQTEFIPVTDPNILYSGRINRNNTQVVNFSYPGTSVKVRFEGRTCLLHLGNISSSGEYRAAGNFYKIIVDNHLPYKISVSGKTKIYKLDLNEGIHTVEIFKLTESFVGMGVFKGLEIEKGKKLLPIERPKRKIEFIGNSITCGFGNEGDSPNCHFSPDTENNYMAYGAITARNLNAEYLAVAYSGKGVILNYSLEGSTLPMIYDRIFPEREEPKWDFKKWQADVVVINLGTNDFAHAVPDSALFVKTYLDFLKTIRKNYPNAHIFCIEGSMIKDGWPVGIPSLTLVKKYIEKAVKGFKNDVDKKIYTFYLATAKEGDFGCDYHPNVQKHKIMAEELTSFIKLKTGW